MKLGVNVDHIATLRQARGAVEPEPVYGAMICEDAGADSIVCHLREDRRHINERDFIVLRKVVQTKLNLEMAVSEEIIKIALKVKPDQITLVPEKRQEITTEGGLDVVSGMNKIKNCVDCFKRKKIAVSLFIDPDKKQIDASKKTNAEFIELHTGLYANAQSEKERDRQLNIMKDAVYYAQKIGLRVNAGHGLTYHNIKDIAQIKTIEELNIGHSIISRAVFRGLYQAVRDMKEIIDKYAKL